MGYARDIIQIDPDHYILFSDRSISLVNFENASDQVLQSIDTGTEPIFIKKQYNEQDNSIQRIILSHNNKIAFLNPESLQLYPWFELNAPIQSVISLNSSLMTNHILASTDNGLYLIDLNGVKEKIDNNSYHSILEYDENLVLLTNNFGMYLLNLSNNKINKIIDNIEFNKKALHNINNKIYAGSVNGLIVISDILSLQNKKETDRKTIYIIAALLIVIIIILVFQSNSQSNIQTETRTDLRKKDVELYIASNLKAVSLNSICEHFNISTRKLYTLTAPQKPGDLIKKTRENSVRDLMRKNNHTLSEIAAITGYSLAYLRNNRRKFYSKPE